jgi:uncharacterized protein (TIGR03083 family)
VTIDYTTHLRADGERMADAVARDLDAHVPTCPDWNVAKLTIHTGQHHRWVADAVRGGGKPPENPPKPGLRGDELVEWFRQGWRDLADLLDRMDDETPAWSWSGDNRVGFWRRRTALETLVHRWDAENATGERSPLAAELAADGVDEMLFVMMLDDATAYRGHAVRATIETMDHPRAWSLVLEDGELPRPSRDALAQTDEDSVSIRGSAEDVLLFLWGRYDADKVDITGPQQQVDGLLKFMQ